MFTLRQQLWSKIQKKQTYVRILVYFALISIGAMTLSNFILYSFFTRITLNEIGNHSKKLLIQKAQSTAFIMDWTIKSVHRFSSAQNLHFFQFALQDFDDPLQTYKVWSELNDIKNNGLFIESVYVYNDFTKQIANTYNGISDKDHFLDSEVFKYIEDWQEPSSIKIVPRKLNTTILGNPYQAQFISIIVKYELNKSQSAFVVNIDSGKLQAYFGNTPDNSPVEVYLVDGLNRILASANHNKFLQDISSDPLLNQTISEMDHGWFSYNAIPAKPLLVVANIDFNSWKLVQIIPEHEIFEGVQKIRNIFYLIYALIFLLILPAIWRLSKNIYSPIEQLLIDVQQNYSQQMDENLPLKAGEVSLLTRVLKWQNATIHRLSASSRKNKLAFRTTFLKELLQDPTYPIQSAASLFTEHELVLSPTSMVVIVFRIDRYLAFTQANSSFDQKLLRYAITNIVKETLGEKYPVETVDMGGDHIVAICNIESEDETAFLTIAIQKCQDNIQTFLSVSTTAALGSFMEQYKELPGVYKAAYELTNERLNHGLGKLTIMENYAAFSAPPYEYPERKEKKILDELKLGHEKEAVQYLDEFIRQVRTYSYSNITLAFLQFIINFGKTLRQMHLQNDDQYNWTLSDIQNQLIDLETIETVRMWLVSIIKQTIESLSDQKESKNKHLINEIREIIRLQLDDPNLSSKLVADHLSFSVNYVRSLFKEETGQPLSEYIKDQRLELVKDLLLKTDLPVEDICLRVGFASIKSFYPIFKKKTGVTPAQFRKDYTLLTFPFDD